MASVAECFEHYGVIKKNPIWSWSGRSADGKTVAVTLWADRLNYKTTPITYAELPPGNQWESSPGNRERLENLIWARDHLNGILRVVIIRSVDPALNDRKIADAHVKEKLVMRLITLDEDTGHFTAEAVSFDPPSA